MFREFLLDEHGATAIEYALITSLIFLAILNAVKYFGETTSATWEYIGDTIKASNEGAP